MKTTLILWVLKYITRTNVGLFGVQGSHDCKLKRVDLQGSEFRGMSGLAEVQSLPSSRSYTCYGFWDLLDIPVVTCTPSCDICLLLGLGPLSGRALDLEGSFRESFSRSMRPRLRAWVVRTFIKLVCGPDCPKRPSMPQRARNAPKAQHARMPLERPRLQGAVLCLFCFATLGLGSTLDIAGRSSPRVLESRARLFSGAVCSRALFCSFCWQEREGELLTVWLIAWALMDLLCRILVRLRTCYLVLAGLGIAHLAPSEVEILA